MCSQGRKEEDNLLFTWSQGEVTDRHGRDYLRTQEVLPVHQSLSTPCERVVPAKEALKGGRCRNGFRERS